METKQVYKAISDVAKVMAADGITKDRKNAQQGFNFRGIDQVYNALAPVLAEHGLVILPRITERKVTERATQRGGVLFYVVVRAEFDFVSVADGSIHTVVTYGEAMDSGDKATNKAMSIAYKYAAFQAFCIPTEQTAQDPDAEIHDPAPQQQQQQQQQQARQAPTPDQADNILKQFSEAIMKKNTITELEEAFRKVWPMLKGTPQQKVARDVYAIRKDELSQQ